MLPQKAYICWGFAMSDPFIHIRMECVRLVMESVSVPSVEAAMREADALVDYIKSGHIAPHKTNGSRTARDLAN